MAVSGTLVFVLAVGAAPGCDCNNTGMMNMDFGVPDLTGGDAAMDLAGGDGIIGVTDAGPICGGGGANCAVNGDCCSNLCEPTMHICLLPQCGNAGAACASATDCCGLACVGNKCGGKCVSDNGACATNGECCSNTCGSNNACTPINTMCKTAGNACTTDNDCCNKKCVGGNANDGGATGQCASPSQVSFCTQTGDICTRDGECCTGICVIAAGAGAGTCQPLTAQGCSVDGELCNGCGTCCSHVCGPFGSSGTDVCQPGSGCHVQGDTCRVNKDCCGGDCANGLPGAGQVACVPDPTYPTKIGTCSGPGIANCKANCPDQSVCTNTCDPEGDVCHLNPTPVCAGANTGVRADCCGCISTKVCCVPDKMGIPRCNALTTCVPQGGSCSFSSDCCNNLPCVPDANGNLHCGAIQGCGGGCTTNGDCATGLTCVVPPGSLQGTCTGAACVADMASPPDLAGVDLAGADLAQPPGDMAMCSQYGQACSTTQPCCNNVQCTNATFTVCTAGQTGCTCFSPIP
jgi:hypothetical protein